MKRLLATLLNSHMFKKVFDLHDKFDPPTNKRFIFILSTGRTGTTFLGDFLNRLDSVYAVHEPKPSWILRMASNAYHDGIINDDRYMLSIYLKARIKLLKNLPDDTTTYVESNPFLHGFAPAIAKHLPNSEIIHIVRDPRDKLRSGVNYGGLRPKKVFVNSFVPFWYMGSIDVFKLRGSLLDNYARSWARINKLIESSQQTNNNTFKYRLYRFEDIFSYDDTIADLIGSILNSTKQPDDVPKTIATNKSRNKSKYNDLPQWRDWSPAFSRRMAKLFGPDMQKYGYGDENEWAELISKRS